MNVQCTCSMSCIVYNFLLFVVSDFRCVYPGVGLTGLRPAFLFLEAKKVHNIDIMHSIINGRIASITSMILGEVRSTCMLCWYFGP